MPDTKTQPTPVDEIPVERIVAVTQVWGWLRRQDLERPRPWMCRVHDHSGDDAWVPVFV